MNKIILMLSVGALLITGNPVIAQQPQQLPSGPQYFQQRISEDAGVIAGLLDKLNAANAEIDALKKAAAATKPAADAPKPPDAKK